MAVHAIAVVALSMLATACSRPLTVPSEVGTVSQLVNALRAHGLKVSVGGETSPQKNGYFSVSSRDVLVGDALLKAFEYGTAVGADADAARISADGQPNPRAHIGWIGAPHFFKHGQLIVLYIGCAEPLLQALDDLIGPVIAKGPGCF
jgi:hypothetical protein